LDQAALYLAVTVRAHQYALFGLLAELAEALSGSHTQSERLGGRIHVVKVQVHHAPVISADRAAAPCLGDKDSLDLLKPARNCFSDAALAAPSGRALAGAVAMKHHKAMAAAVAQGRGALRLRRASFARDQRRRCDGFCA